MKYVLIVNLFIAGYPHVIEGDYPTMVKCLEAGLDLQISKPSEVVIKSWDCVTRRMK